MGAANSRLEKEIDRFPFPSDERYFGLVNFGNTCYCNSVLQALYFCKPFRERVLLYRKQTKGMKKETLLTCLADLFHKITTEKKKVGQIPPKKFIQRLRRENEVFDNSLPQDAHEFLNYLLNQVADLLIADELSGELVPDKKSIDSHKDQRLSGGCDSNESFTRRNWVHEIFQGTLTNETRCRNCETVRTKDEDFLDLSVDVEQNTSITYCLRCFSNTETIQSENKYYCEVCCCKQEAQKQMRVKHLPLLLVLHLKRFKYVECFKRFTKLSYCVNFPSELRLCNTSDDAVNADRLYELIAVVVHCGSGPNRGHYISLVKSQGIWLLFDDEIVDKIDPVCMADFFGSPSETTKSSDSAYILFYQARDAGHSSSDTEKLSPSL